VYHILEDNSAFVLVRNLTGNDSRFYFISALKFEWIGKIGTKVLDESIHSIFGEKIKVNDHYV
jgi:hypothetical protein